MTTPRPLIEARRLAADHGCMVTECGGKFLVYRKTTARPVFLGSRGTPESLRAFVRRVTTSTGTPAPALPTAI